MPDDVPGEDTAAAIPEMPKKAKRVKRAQAPDPIGKEQAAATESRKSNRRGRSTRPFPAVPFDEALDFAKEIYDFGSGQQVRRLSLFDHLQRTPDSGPSRQLVTNANKYGLLKGNYASDHLELTQEGKRVCDENTTPREKARTKAKLAISDIGPFEGVYDRFINSKLPARAALIDAMRESGVDSEYLEEAVDTFIVNLKAVGLLQNLSGADRVITVEHLLDTLPGHGAQATFIAQDSAPINQGLVTQEQASFESTCFYITPIGEEDSEERKHSNLFLENIVEPAIRTIGLTVVRADQIDRPGLITRQIIEYILRSRLVVADLSFSKAIVYLRKQNGSAKRFSTGRRSF